MKKIYTLFFFYACLNFSLIAQTNIYMTHPAAEQILKGNYDPSGYTATNVIDHPDSIAKDLLKYISPDSLKDNIIRLARFKNRNTASDTISATHGIGAARTWVYNKFNQYSKANENRLITSYLQFDLSICGVTRHKNVIGILPGTDTSDKSIIIIEGHMDSRCVGLCDTLCSAQGVEDNATGSVLVMELARVMSRFSFHHTIVFMVNTGEEQGLFGADALADYCKDKKIQISAVLNNDVIGGVTCGHTASPPGCTGFNSIDSVNVRIFSLGGFNSPHKQLARYIKLEHKELILPKLAVKTKINIMTPEDRTNRSGDHIPFRKLGYTAIRFTSANEHGDASNGANYSDRQHTSNDTLGVDTNNDNVVDSFYISFTYLARNAYMNGIGAAMAAISPKTPDFTADLTPDSTKLIISIISQKQYMNYRVGLRTISNDWDSVYTMTNKLVDTLTVAKGKNYIASVASVDNRNVESLFSQEKMVFIVGLPPLPSKSNGLQLLPNYPNPFDEATMISVLVNQAITYQKAEVIITDLQGKEVQRLPIQLQPGMNEVEFNHGYHVSGTYHYSLAIDGKIISSRQMVFVN